MPLIYVWADVVQQASLAFPVDGPVSTCISRAIFGVRTHTQHMGV